MEEIKLPKFKTKEELEQFAMGLMTEIEAFKKIITLKDDSIKGLEKQLGNFIAVKMESDIRRNEIHDLKNEIKSLKEKSSENYYKDLYCKECEKSKELRDKCCGRGIELEEIGRKVHKLSSMVTFMFGLLPRFKAKRVYDAFGEFNAAEYRL